MVTSVGDVVGQRGAGRTSSGKTKNNMTLLNSKGDRRGINRMTNPTPAPKNHPWRKTWVESPEGYQRSLRSGFILNK